MTDILSGIKSPGARRLTVVKLKTGNNLGFTLPEMLIAMCIMVVMTLIAVPTFMNLLPEMRLNSSARQVYMAFSRAKQGAVTQNADACVKFSQSNKTILVWLDNGPGSARGNSAKDASESYVFEGSLDDGILISSHYPGDTVTFDARGLPKSAGWFQDNFLAYWIFLMNGQNQIKSIRITPVGGIKIS